MKTKLKTTQIPMLRRANYSSTVSNEHQTPDQAGFSQKHAPTDTCTSFTHSDTEHANGSEVFG